MPWAVPEAARSPRVSFRPAGRPARPACFHCAGSRTRQSQSPSSVVPGGARCLRIPTSQQRAIAGSASLCPPQSTEVTVTVTIGPNSPPPLSRSQLAGDVVGEPGADSLWRLATLRVPVVDGLVDLLAGPRRQHREHQARARKSGPKPRHARCLTRQPGLEEEPYHAWRGSIVFGSVVSRQGLEP